MNIRPAEPRDQAAIRELLLSAFPGPDEADLVERLRAEGDAAIELVAEDDGDIVGHILFSPMEAPFTALALAPVAVAPDRQREGVGSALIEAGHEAARQKGTDGIFVLGDPVYYQRFGYDLSLAAGFDSPYAGAHFMALALAGALPAREGTLAYARAFAALG